MLTARYQFRFIGNAATFHARENVLQTGKGLCQLCAPVAIQEIQSAWDQTDVKLHTALDAIKSGIKSAVKFLLGAVFSCLRICRIAINPGIPPLRSSPMRFNYPNLVLLAIMAPK